MSDQEDPRRGEDPAAPLEGSSSPGGSPSAPPAEPATRPLFQERYELGSVLGRGGTCTVYRAWDTRLHRDVALKRLEPPLSEDLHTRARFSREGKAIARLSHPSLVTLIDRGSTEDTEYLVYEYVEGRPLKEVVKSDGPFSPQRAVRIAGEMAEGLSYAHWAGIYHRDVKPQNILLDGQGRARLTDFGIATGPEWTRVTRAGAIVGSSRYMSPEQVQGRPVDGRTDIYSLGIVLYEMLAGSPPFDGTTIAEIGRQHIRSTPPPLSDARDDLAAGLIRIVERCLEKLPESRFQSMDELLGALVGIGLYDLERSHGVLDGLRRAGQALRGAAGADGMADEDAAPPSQAAPAAGGFEAERQARPEDWAWSDSWAGASPLEESDAWDGLASERADTFGRRAAQPAYRYLLVLLPAAVLGLLVLGWYGLIRPQAALPEVPDVVGISLEEARAAAEKARLELQEDPPVLAADVAAGTVVTQQPEAGARPEDGQLTVAVARGAVAVKVVTLADLDPEGDGVEQPDLLPNLNDKKADTAWETEFYGTAQFSGLKQGVGVTFTLEDAASMVRVDAALEGWRAELRARASDGTVKVLAQLEGKKSQTLTLNEPIRAGEIWITQLAPAEREARFHVVLTELTFSR